MKTIKYYTKNVYGKELIYLDSYSASLWLSMTGKYTITEYQMNLLGQLTNVKFERVFEREVAHA